MLNSKYILKIAKTLFMVFAVLFLLTACNDGESAKETSLIDENYKSTTVDENGRPVNDKFIQAQANCWQSNVLILIYDTLGKATMQVYGDMTKGALSLMMMAFAIWFVMRLLAHVGSITEENIAEVWKEVFIKFFVCFVCGIIASNTEMIIYILNILIFPIYTAFLEFGSEILQQGKTSGTYENLFGKKVTFAAPLLCKVEGSIRASIEGGFPEAPRNMMSCMVCSVNERLIIGADIAFNSMSGISWIGIVLGAIVYICFLFVRLGFVFYLVDTVFRFAIMIILLPILIMAYAFKATKKWTSTGLIMILNSSAFMCAIAIIMTITLLAMEELFSANSDFLSGEVAATERIEDFSVFFLCMMLICFLLLQSVQVAKQVSDSLVGSSGDAKFQKKLKATIQFIASILIGLITLGTGTAAKGTIEGLKKGMKQLNKGRKKAGGKIAGGAKALGNKFMSSIDSQNQKGE